MIIRSKRHPLWAAEQTGRANAETLDSSLPMIELRKDPAHEATGSEAIQPPVIAEISIDRPPHAHCLSATEAALLH